MATEASNRAKMKYDAKAYDRINLKVKKGRKDELQAHAQECGESLNGFINRAIDKTVEADKNSTDEKED